LNDLWSVDLVKLDGWVRLYEGNAPEESIVREESESDGSVCADIDIDR